MNRKQLLKMGACGCAFPIVGQAAPEESKGTPCAKRMEFSETWVKRFMDVLGQNLDKATLEKIMEANGRACFQGAHGEPKPNPPADALDKFMARYNGYEANAVYREGNVIHFKYIGNPQGLKVSDGHCLCPLTETVPKGISGMYCQCSAGYVGEMFRGFLGKPVKVELVDSLLRGGKECRFKIYV
ncbi:MAG: DUF6144 family protein [Bryobacteraceae bacterium]|jgi:hypothetical protein